MIRAWCRSGPNVQTGYVKYVEPQAFYQWCCVGSNSGGVLVSIPCVKAQTSSRWCDVEARRGGLPAQVLSSSLDTSSKLRLSPKTLE
ncbi:hypothetical protein TNCV_664621 [Trichonephila clavipes]|nr:hypothetical protein TNCV_664621 [Trichonephila clavipes]